MADMDLVVRIGESTEELRYAIRSWEQNLPHARLVTAGTWVPWLTCEHINLPLIGVPDRGHAYKVLKAVLDDDRLTDQVIVADDDMFLLKPLDRLPAYHCGRLMAVHRPQLGGVKLTARLIGDRVCRDLHVPTVVDRSVLRDQLRHLEETLTRAEVHKVLWRAYHYDKNEIPSFHPDAKLRAPDEPFRDRTWVSTDEATFAGPAGEKLREMFPKPSKWERIDGA